MGIGNLILLLIPLALQGFLLVVLFRRRLYWEYPFFFGYVGYSVIAIAALLTASSHYRIYFFVYWANSAMLNVLAILALHEVFRRVFWGFYIQYRWFRSLFPAAAGIAFLIVFWSNAGARGSQAYPPMKLILLWGTSVNFIQAAIFCLLVFIAKTVRLQWRVAPLGILLGFTLSALGTAISYWSVSQFGTRFKIFAGYVPPIAYILSIIVWLDTFLRPEPEPKWVSAGTFRQVAEQIRQDTVALRKVLDRSK